MEASTSGGVLPGGLRWNTHVACLARVCDYGGLPFDAVDVAGMTGLAFRTLAVKGLPPGGMYHTWSFSHYFQQWFDALGIVTVLGEHDTRQPTYPGWLGFWHGIARQSISSGFPVVFWDNVCFNLLTAIEDGYYSATTIPANVVPPGLDAIGFAPRISDGQSQSGIISRVPESQVTPEVGNRAFFACPILHCGTDMELSLIQSLKSARMEMNGQLPFTRPFDGAGDYPPQFGTNGVALIAQEVGNSYFSAFGAKLAVCTVAEARRLGCKYLKRITGTLGDALKPRLELVTEFLERTTAMWADVCLVWDEQEGDKRRKAVPDYGKMKDKLLEIQRTEDTAAKVIAGLVADLEA